MSLCTGWREQFERMLRSHSQLRSMACGFGNQYLTSDGARDVLYHFFEDSYHLKDWIKNDPTADGQGVEKFINDTLCLRITADLANGVKHLRLTSSRTGDLSTAVTSQSVRYMNRRETGDLRSYAYQTWEVQSNGKQYDAHELAGEVVTEWRGWLESKGLLP